MTPVSKDTTAGKRYLELQQEARRSDRPTDELFQLYALECFLDRLTRSAFAKQFVLKGGVLLAALDARRPTRDIDFAARAMTNDTAIVLDIVRKVASIDVDDGVVFDFDHANAETIREEEAYGGVRVSLTATLARADIHLHVDVNIGDPIWPDPEEISLPRLLDAPLVVRGYSIEMVLAEKVVTAMVRGTTSTRWRDFLDIYTIVGRHDVDGPRQAESFRRVAEHRDAALVPLSQALVDYAEIAQTRWSSWREKNRLESNAPLEFSGVLEVVIRFADPIIDGATSDGSWSSASGSWGAKVGSGD